MNRKSLSTIILVCIAMLVVQLGLGAYPVIVSKFAKRNHADPLIFGLIRDGLSFPVLLLASYVSEKRIIFPKLREFPIFIVLGFTGIFLGQICYLLGIYFISADITSLFQSLSIIWVCILSVAMRVEPIPNVKKLHGFVKLLGITLAFAGAIITAYGRYSKTKSESKDHNSTNLDEILGFLSLIVNTSCTGIYIVVQKKYIFKNSSSRFKEYPVTVTTWSYLFGFVFMLLASLYYSNKPEKFSSVTNDSVYPLVYAVFITSTLCYMLTSWSTMEVDPTVVSAFWPLQVLFGVVLAYFILNETVNAIEITGGVLMIFALFAVLWSNYRENTLNCVEFTEIITDF